MHGFNDYKKVVDTFPCLKIGVVADLIADVYIYGRPFKLSREAPVIVVKYEGEEIVPGGGANTINNILKLGAKVFPVGVVGEDETGRQLKGYFEKEGVITDGIFICKDRITPSKTRLLAGDLHTSKRQVVRIDKEPVPSIPPAVEEKILGYMDEVNKLVSGWVISEYGYGILTPRILEKVKSFAWERVLVVDTRYRLCDFAVTQPETGVKILSPNEQEAEEAAGIPMNGEGDLLKIGKTLLEKLNPEALLITRGNHGMTLFEKTGKIEHIPISGPNEVTDVTGAGDTVTALLGLALLTGVSFSQAARLSNYAAGVVVMKNGTATLTRDELLEAIQRDVSLSK